MATVLAVIVLLSFREVASIYFGYKAGEEFAEPLMMLDIRNFEGDMTTMCCASVIDDLNLLSAAHCFQNMTATGKITVYSGVEPFRVVEVLKAGDVHVHHGYNSSTRHNDIAILHLLKPLVDVQHMKLDLTWNGGADADYFILGWGRSEFINTTTYPLLMFAEVDVMNPCPPFVVQTGPYEYNAGQVCYEDKKGRMFGGRQGEGDSGCPLVQGGKGQVAIMSMMNRYFDAATRLSEYASWIAETMKRPPRKMGFLTFGYTFGLIILTILMWRR